MTPPFETLHRQSGITKNACASVLTPANHPNHGTLRGQGVRMAFKTVNGDALAAVAQGRPEGTLAHRCL